MPLRVSDGQMGQRDTVHFGTSMRLQNQKMTRLRPRYGVYGLIPRQLPRIISAVMQSWRWPDRARGSPFSLLEAISGEKRSYSVITLGHRVKPGLRAESCLG